MTIKLTDLVPCRRKHRPGQSGLSKELSRTMPRVFARDQCRLPKHCCEIIICCGRGKQSVSKKLGNPVTGRKNFSVHEAKALGYLAELLHRAGRGYEGASKSLCEEGVDKVVHWTQAMDEGLLRHLPEDVALPVAWWCSMVPYLVGVLEHRDLPPGPFHAATTAFFDIYKLTRDDLYLEVQVLLWQAVHVLAHLITPAAKEGLEALVSQEARSQAAELLKESIDGLSQRRSNKTAREKQVLHPEPVLLLPTPAALCTSVMPQGTDDMDLEGDSYMLESHCLDAAEFLQLDAAVSFPELLPIGSNCEAHTHYSPCPQLDEAALTAIFPDILDMPSEAGVALLEGFSTDSIFEDGSFRDILHPAGTAELELLQRPCNSECSNLSCSLWDLPSLPLDEATLALHRDCLGIHLLSTSQATQQDIAMVRPLMQAASPGAATPAASGPLHCSSMEASTKHPSELVVSSLPHPVPAAAMMLPVLQPIVGQISQPLCSPHLHPSPRFSHTGRTVTS